VVMMASADEGRAARPGRRQNLENLQPPRRPIGQGVRPEHCALRSYVIPPVFQFRYIRPDKLRTML